jgi:hypothetical protein
MHFIIILVFYADFKTHLFIFQVFDLTLTKFSYQQTTTAAACTINGFSKKKSFSMLKMCGKKFAKFYKQKTEVDRGKKIFVEIVNERVLKVRANKKLKRVTIYNKVQVRLMLFITHFKLMLCLFVSLSLCGYVCVMRFRCQCLC